MQAKLSESLNAVGYLTAEERDSVGYVGALLVLSPAARPLEFHCTQPIRPTPAQAVLYGETLNQHLLGEQIPLALLEKAKRKPEVLLINDPGLISIRQLIDLPVVLYCQGESLDSADIADSHDQMIIGDLLFLSVAGHSLAIHSAYERDREWAETAAQAISSYVEVQEPFERLAIAINETCRQVNDAA